MMNGAPIINSGTTFPRSRAMTAMVAPKDKDPTSPSQILAGKMLKYKKAIREPIQRAKKTEIGVSRELFDMNQKAKRQIIRRPQERPSNPSVMLKKLEKPVIKRTEIGI